MEIIKLKGVTKNYPWGGYRLKQYGKTSDDIMAESWELSIHQDGFSVVDSGKYKGQSLKEYLENNNVLGNRNELNIMIKYIDTKDSTSVQVHPNDEYALKVEKQLGKTELWYIMDALEGSYVFYGVNKEITTAELKERIKNNTILEVLNKVETKKGDSFLLEAGTIHAIGPGNVICEIQQNSNLTYRLYDYGRYDKYGNLRELHIDKAMEVVKTNPNMVFNSNIGIDNYREIGSCKYFETVHFISKDEVYLFAKENYHVINFLDGKGKIENLEYKKGDTFLVPANYGTYKIIGKCEFLRTISKL